jgi:uncharacterized protein YjbJ (UPF0337 family)
MRVKVCLWSATFVHAPNQDWLWASRRSAEAASGVAGRLLTRETEEKFMKPSTKDQMQGKLHELKGKAKEKVGNATNNPNLTAEGVDEKMGGKIQKKVGQIEKVLEK